MVLVRNALKSLCVIHLPVSCVFQEQLWGLKYENREAIYVPKTAKHKIFLFSISDLIPIQKNY